MADASEKSDGEMENGDDCSIHPRDDDDEPKVIAKEDITAAFVKAASVLAPGEMVMREKFSLLEAMSAIELMDPKMDGGMVRLREYLSPEEALAEGWLIMSDEDLLATVDATLACLASWLEGQFIAQTMHTNLLITEPDVLSAWSSLKLSEKKKEMIPEQTMTALAHGLAHFSLLIRHTISTAAVYEEQEDFSLAHPLCVTSSLSPEEMLKLLKQTEKTLLDTAKAAKERALVLTAIAERLSWLRNICHGLEHMVIPSAIQKDGTPAANPFKPRLKQAIECLQVAVDCSTRFYDTVELGTMAPVGQDGNYEWLKCFISDLNRRFLPPAFPRKTEFLTRRTGLRQLEKMSRRLYDISTNVPHVVQEIGTIIDYLRSFVELESCALSRAALQLVVLPNDERVLGEVLLGDIIRESIANTVAPPIFFKDSPTSRDETCLVLFEEFINEAVRVYLLLIQTLGHNITRHRDKFGASFVQLEALRERAELTDREMVRCTKAHEERHGGQLRGPPAGHHLVTFVMQQCARLLRWHFECGFRLQLFADYEYAFAWWYMRDVVFKWTRDSTDQGQKFIYCEHQAAVVQLSEKKKDKEKGKPKAGKLNKLDDKFRKRLLALRSVYLLGEDKVFSGYLNLCLGLIANKSIKVPEWTPGVSERLRFEHRTISFLPLQPPFYQTFDEYKLYSGYDEAVKEGAEGAKTCFQNASNFFNTAREILESRGGESARAFALARVCRQNHIVCKILASGARPGVRVDFDFSDTSFPFCPLLKLAS